ncbi:MAG: hypothetical protein ACLSB9_33650 [Hydrogeniiclostridium mannosilyticum]
MKLRSGPRLQLLTRPCGSVLRNDEVIVYQEDQTTIKYLVELKA